MMNTWNLGLRKALLLIAAFCSVACQARDVRLFDEGWLFLLGDEPEMAQPGYDDSRWRRLSLPHDWAIEGDFSATNPSGAGGGALPGGVGWYRKHFTPEENWKGKQLFLHFEAIMGKSKVWVNGELLTEHFGGFLPVIVDVTSYLKYGEDNVIAVWADNSDDPSYPPGKQQDMLDFAYFGGIYRDCWMIAHNTVYITDPNYEKEVAGGGLFV